MLYNTLLLESITSPGSSGFVDLPASDVPLLLRVSSTQSGGVSSAVVLHVLGNRGLDAVAPVSISGTGSKVVVVPTPSAVLHVGISCTAGSATVRLEQVLGGVRSIGDLTVDGDLVLSGIASGFQLVTVSGANTTVNLDLGFNIDVALGASTIFDLVNPKDGERYVFWVTQGNNFNITWPGNVIWSPALLPVSVGVGKIDVFTLLYKASINKFGGSFNQDFA